MKKEIKGRYKVSEQLSDKTSALIMIVSGISVLLLMVYFGISLTSKGTFSANGTYSCSTGVLRNVSTDYKCCPTDFPSLAKLSATDTGYMISGGFVCYNGKYNSTVDKQLSGGGTMVYCFTSDYTDAVSCTAAGGDYSTSGCFVPCAKAPLGDATFTPTVCTYTYQGLPSGNIVTVKKSDDSCDCPGSSWTPSTTNMNYCTTALTHDDSTHATSYPLSGMTTCANGYEKASDGRCRVCDEGYEFTNSGKTACQLAGQETDPECAWGSTKGRTDGKCEDHCVAGIPGLVGSPSKSSCEAVYRGYTCTEITANTLYSCVGNKPSCSVSIGDCNLQADTNGQRVDADIYVTSPVSYTYQWEFSGDGYKGGAPSSSFVSLPQNEFTPVSANPYYSKATQSLYNINTNPSGDISAKITIRLSTGGSCTFTKNISLTPCTDCGSGDGETIRADKCYKTGDNTGVIAWVQTCSKTSSEIQGVTCSSLTDTAQGTCYISYTNTNGQSVTATVPRCSIKELDNPACSTTPTNPTTPITQARITCYYCDSNNTRRSYISDTGSCNNSSYPSATTNSNLDCSEKTITRTCWYCSGIDIKSKSVTMTEDETCEDRNYLASNNVSQCRNTCYYCNGTDKESTYIPKANNCSDYNGYASKAADLTCDAEKKTCFHCVGKTAVGVQIDASDNCSNHTGYKEKQSDLTCTKTCWTCEGTSKVSVDIASSETCAANNYADNKNDLTCVQEKKCCACDGSKKVTKGDSTNGKCPSGQTICEQLVCTNSQTGSTAIIIAWIVGVLAIGYSFYYFRQTNKQQ